MFNTVIIKREGIDIGFTFSMLSMEMFCQAVNIDFSEYGEYVRKNPVTAQLTLLYVANVVYTKGEPVLNSDAYEMDSFYSSLTSDDLKKINDTLTSSMKVFTKNSGAEDVKKK